MTLQKVVAQWREEKSEIEKEKVYFRLVLVVIKIQSYLNAIPIC